mgnify:CR=1 FL=1
MPKQLYIPLPCAVARRDMILRQLGPGSKVAAALSETGAVIPRGMRQALHACNLAPSYGWRQPVTLGVLLIRCVRGGLAHKWLRLEGIIDRNCLVAIALKLRHAACSC